MALLNKKQLLQKDDLQIKKVWLTNEDYVCVRQMTGRERDQFEQSMLKPIKDQQGNIVDYERQLEDFRAKLAACTICDEEGKLLLHFNDYLKLSQQMSAKKLEKIVNTSQELNRITDEDKEAMVKNSKGGQNEDSTSD